MYEQVEKTPEKQSKSVANAVSQRQNSNAPTPRFVDNRPEAIQMRKLRDLAKHSPQNDQLRDLHHLAAAHSVTQKKSNVKQGLGFVDNRPQAKEDAQLHKLIDNSCRTKKDPELNFKPQIKHVQKCQDTVQARFYERNVGGLVWWKRPMFLAGGKDTWRPWIDSTTGSQEMHQGYGVWFNFDKTGLTRQKVKGVREGFFNNTTGLSLGDQNEFNALGGLGPWPGARNWPGAMSRANNATNRRNAVEGVPHGDSSWGHQLAMQWGGPARQNNAASATNSDSEIANGFAQEEYQTIVEDALTRVVADDGLNLSDFRLKHTAYLYPGTNVAKYMRIKIYKQGNMLTGIYKVVDLVTPDFAEFVAGGRAQAGTPRQALQMSIEQLIRSGWKGRLNTKKGTHKRTVRSWDDANINTANR